MVQSCLCYYSGKSYAVDLWPAIGMLEDSLKAVMQETLRNYLILDTEMAILPGVDSVCDELPPADVAFDNLHIAGVSISAKITLEGFADAEKDLELCTALTNEEIIRQVAEDSDDSEIKEAAPIQPKSSELTRALKLSLLYSDSMALAEIEADIITGKLNALQIKIRLFFT